MRQEILRKPPMRPVPLSRQSNEKLIWKTIYNCSLYMMIMFIRAESCQPYDIHRRKRTKRPPGKNKMMHIVRTFIISKAQHQNNRYRDRKVLKFHMIVLFMLGIPGKYKIDSGSI